MSRIVESLRRLCRVEPTIDEIAKQMTAMSGLPVLRGRPSSCDDLQFWARLEPLIEQRRLSELASLCQREFAVRGRFENGRSRHAMVLRALLAPIEQVFDDPEQCEERLAAYESWWQRDRHNPQAAGVYAAALAVTGYAYRGIGPATDVTAPQWALLSDFANRAIAVLGRAGEGRGACWIWNMCNMRATFVAYGAGEASTHDLRRAFEATMVLDPLDVSVYEERAAQLLPCWGGSAEELDLLARQAYATTQKDIGAEMYARIYDAIISVEEPDATLLDYHFLREGFCDWLGRTPSQPLANRFAAHAHIAGDLETLTWLFRTEIREIYPNAWFGPRQPLAAWQDCVSAQRTRH